MNQVTGITQRVLVGVEIQMRCAIGHPANWTDTSGATNPQPGDSCEVVGIVDDATLANLQADSQFAILSVEVINVS